jgi:hypothetical protein
VRLVEPSWFRSRAGPNPPLLVPDVDFKFEQGNVELDNDRIDEAVLALLHLGLHDRNRVWKSFDWDVLARLYEKGYISNPIGHAKSVTFTEEGLRESERLLQQTFGARG